MNYKARRRAFDRISREVLLNIYPGIKQVKPVWMQDYMPGGTLFTLKQGAILSEGIAWFMNHDAPLEFVKLLKEGFKEGFSHVVSVENEFHGLEASVGGIQHCELLKYFDDPSYIVVCREPDNMNEDMIKIKLNYQRTLLGNDYDYGVFPWFAFMSLTGLQKYSRRLRKMTPIGHKKGARVCSSFEADGFRQAYSVNFQPCKLFQEWNVLGIHVNRLFLDFPYKPFKIGEERIWLR